VYPVKDASLWCYDIIKKLVCMMQSLHEPIVSRFAMSRLVAMAFDGISWMLHLLACASRGFRSGQVRFSTLFGHNQNLNQLVFLQKLSNQQPDHIQPVVISRWDSCDQSKPVKTQLRLSSVCNILIVSSSVVTLVFLMCLPVALHTI
jgi:hypothetical protein